MILDAILDSNACEPFHVSRHGMRVKYSRPFPMNTAEPLDSYSLFSAAAAFQKCHYRAMTMILLRFLAAAFEAPR